MEELKGLLTNNPTNCITDTCERCCPTLQSRTVSFKIQSHLQLAAQLILESFSTRTVSANPWLLAFPSRVWHSLYRFRTTMRAHRAFSCTAPSFWNHLPLNIRTPLPQTAQETIPCRLKTQVFRPFSTFKAKTNLGRRLFRFDVSISENFLVGALFHPNTEIPVAVFLAAIIFTNKIINPK